MKGSPWCMLHWMTSNVIWLVPSYTRRRQCLQIVRWHFNHDGHIDHQNHGANDNHLTLQCMRLQSGGNKLEGCKRGEEGYFLLHHCQFYHKEFLFHCRKEKTSPLLQSKAKGAQIISIKHRRTQPTQMEWWKSQKEGMLLRQRIPRLKIPRQCH